VGIEGASDPTVLAPARPDVIEEVVAGEAVLVHLGTGRYYALDRGATALWSWLGAGASTAALAAAPGLDPAWREAALALVAVWRDEGLVVPTDGADRTDAPDASEDVPAMRSFHDLEDLLLLDPIHDVVVDDDGFPVTRPAG
jgi:hypothetical protein